MHSIIQVILLVLYCYTLLTIISVILLENRNPVKSLSWVLILVFLPVIGMWLYLLLGQEYRKKKIISKISIQKVLNRPVESVDIQTIKESNRFTDNQFNLLKMLYASSDSRLYAGNKIDVFTEGKATFESLFEAIEKATDHIHIEFFIFEDDELSNRLRELLISKAKTKVRVRMIYDYWGSFRLSKKYVRSLRDAGVYVKPFLPFRWQISRTNKVNYRNHRKLVIVDGTVGFTGGVNIANRYLYGNSLGEWRDTFVRIEGAAVHGLQMLFMIDWYFVEKKYIDGEKYFPKPKHFEDNIIQIVHSGPDTDWQSVMQGICAAIMSATRYIYIHTPYFMPNDVVIHSLEMAALSGVDVRLIIPSRSDSRLSDASTTSYLGQILEAGAKVYHYQTGFMHSKAIVIDDYLSIIGSTNMDERSFEHNFEANAFIYDKITAQKLYHQYFTDLRKSNPFTLDEWQNRKRSQKLKESFARLFSPLL